MKLSSVALGAEGQILQKYTKDGENISPPVRWEEVPRGARELVLIFEQTTPKTQPPQSHWLVYRIPPDLRELPGDLGHKAEPDRPVGLRHGRNGWGNNGYDGPLGSVGRVERYRLRLLALDEASDLPPGATAEQLHEAIDGHVMDEATMETAYARPRA